MGDLRDQPAIDAEKAANDAIYLEYHSHSPWAAAKVAAGLRLNPQAVAYMERENAANRDAKVRFDAENAKFEAQRRREHGIHDSDCAINNGPAMVPGPCDCTLSKTVPNAPA